MILSTILYGIDLINKVSKIACSLLVLDGKYEGLLCADTVGPMSAMYFCSLLYRLVYDIAFPISVFWV